jgi:hypothetical protein
MGKAAPDHKTHKGLPVVTFEAFLEDKLCEKLNKVPFVNTECNIAVANITFGFDNPKLVNELVSRGSTITAGKLEKLPEINEKIDKICKEEKTELIRPVAAFITFDNQEGKNRALKYLISPKDKKALENDPTPEHEKLLQDSKFYLVGEEAWCKQAPEPSEIIWHNRHVTTKQQNCRKVLVFLVCLIFLGLMFFFFSWMKSKAINNMWRYPTTTNCGAVTSMFSGKDPTTGEMVVDLDDYQKYADIDKPLTNERQGSGIYLCFCLAYKSNPGVGYLDENDLCYQRFHQYVSGYAISQSVTIVITIVNTIITMLCKFLISKVGYHTITGEITAVTMSIFLASFFNTAILLLLADADLSQITLLSWIPIAGPFPDLTEQWYIVVAPSLIMTMMINAFYPYIDLGISFGTLALYRCLDQGFSTYICCKKEKTTKCKTIQAYVNIYAGPMHAMSYRYSAILVATWICMMYGVALPIMFPIGSITMFNYYIVDRLLIAYYFRRPPIYDDKLNKYALVMLKYAPVLLLFFGYWTIGNMQVFNADIVPLVNSGIPLITNHSTAPAGNQSLPLFIIGVIILTVFIATDCCSSCLKKIHLMPSDDVELLNEDIGTYFECIPINERKRWYAQELYANKKLGISTMGEYAKEALRTRNGDYRVIKNAPNYEMLSNITYCQQF